MTADGARSRLVAELERALRRAGAAESAIESVMADACRLDGAGRAAVPDTLAESGARLARRVEALLAALDRCDRGTYGTCERCGGAIEEARLELMPATRRCRRCAAAADDG